MKTLVVKYIPRGDRSNTKQLVDAFCSHIKNSEIEELDLVKDVPDLFLDDNLMYYIQRDYLGQELSQEQKRRMEKMDKMTAQLKLADIVVVGYPMFNFSMPAAVKAWFDSVMLKGKTWDVKDGKYFGTMGGKKGLVLVTSGGIYSKEPMASWEHAFSLGKAELQFMGYSDVRGVFADGMNAGEDTKSTNLQKSIEQVRTIAQEWYNK